MHPEGRSCGPGADVPRCAPGLLAGTVLDHHLRRNRSDIGAGSVRYRQPSGHVRAQDTHIQCASRTGFPVSCCKLRCQRTVVRRPANRSWGDVFRLAPPGPGNSAAGREQQYADSSRGAFPPLGTGPRAVCGGRPRR
jgi:hypothetical protein